MKTKFKNFLIISLKILGQLLRITPYIGIGFLVTYLWEQISPMPAPPTDFNDLFMFAITPPILLRILSWIGGGTAWFILCKILKFWFFERD